jgi:hypothetical protein
VKSLLRLSSAILLTAGIVSWRLVYAFVEEKEPSKEEKTRGKNWEIAQISCLVSKLVFLIDPSTN